MATCRSCGAEIVWTMTRHGRLQPLDAEPVDDGPIRLLDEWIQGKHGAVQRSEVLPQCDSLFPIYEERFNPHHMTCPQAHQWRRNDEARAS